MLWGQTPNPSMSRLLLAWSDSWCQSWSLSFHVLALSLHGSWFSRSSLRFKQKSVAVPQMNAGFNACYTSQLTAMKMPLNLIAPFLQQPVMYSSCRKKGVKASGIMRAICLTNASSSRILSPGPMSPTAQSGRSFQDISPHPSVGEVSALPSAGQSPSASPDGLSAGWGGLRWPQHPQHHLLGAQGGEVPAKKQLWRAQLSSLPGGEPDGGGGHPIPTTPVFSDP